MDVINEILTRLGIPDASAMEVNESYTIHVEGFEDLTIEKISGSRVSVAHHYLQRGDVMCDPEIVFDISGDDWIPIRYTHHPFVHQYEPDGLDLDGFIEEWSQNLRRQGFVTASEQHGSPT